VRGTYWAYTDQSIFELSIDNETSDVWKIYLEKGQFEAALEYSKESTIDYRNPDLCINRMFYRRLHKEIWFYQRKRRHSSMTVDISKQLSASRNVR
jgi:hypothetical protein